MHIPQITSANAARNIKLPTLSPLQYWEVASDMNFTNLSKREAYHKQLVIVGEIEEHNNKDRIGIVAKILYTQGPKVNHMSTIHQHNDVTNCKH
jgi:hypothetical protein